MRTLILAILVTCIACTDPHTVAQQANTVEAYEKFLAENPHASQRTVAELRLQELVLERARTGKTLEGYDDFLKRYPKGKLYKVAITERREFLWAWADENDTADGWQKYLDEYPTGNRKLQIQAKKRLNMAKHRTAVEIGPVKMERVNLAEDPNGPLNGYGFYADVINKGDQPIQTLMIQISYLSAAGRALERDQWPAVATRLPGNLPFEEGFDAPIESGKTRTWEWTTGKLPEGWSKKVRLAPVDIRFSPAK